MRTNKDYQIKEENDTGEEHAKLVLSRLVQNPDKTVNEIIKDVVPSDFNKMLLYTFERYVSEALNKEPQHNKSSDGEENKLMMGKRTMTKMEVLMYLVTEGPSPTNEWTEAGMYNILRDCIWDEPNKCYSKDEADSLLKKASNN